MRDHTDEDLFDLYRANPAAPEGSNAFGLIVERYTKPLQAMLQQRMCGNADWAQDAAQDVFLRVIRSAKLYDREIGPFAKWLYWVAFNTFADNYRKGHRLITNFKVDGPRSRHQKFRDVSCLEDIVAANQPLPSVQLEEQETKERFWECVNSMSPEKRQAVILVYVEGMTYKAAAQSVGVPITTLKKRVVSEHKKLRKALGTHDKTELRVHVERRTEFRPRVEQRRAA